MAARSKSKSTSRHSSYWTECWKCRAYHEQRSSFRKLQSRRAESIRGVAWRNEMLSKPDENVGAAWLIEESRLPLAPLGVPVDLESCRA